MSVRAYSTDLTDHRILKKTQVNIDGKIWENFNYSSYQSLPFLISLSQGELL